MELHCLFVCILSFEDSVNNTNSLFECMWLNFQNNAVNSKRQLLTNVTRLIDHLKVNIDSNLRLLIFNGENGGLYQYKLVSNTHL